MTNKEERNAEVCVTTRISESLDFILARTAKRQCRTKSEIVRRALEAYLYDSEMGTKASLLAALANLQEAIDRMPEEAFKPEPKGRSRR